MVEVQCGAALAFSANRKYINNLLFEVTAQKKYTVAFYTKYGRYSRLALRCEFTDRTEDASSAVEIIMLNYFLPRGGIMYFQYSYLSTALVSAKHPGTHGAYIHKAGCVLHYLLFSFLRPFPFLFSIATPYSTFLIVATRFRLSCYHGDRG